MFKYLLKILKDNRGFAVVTHGGSLPDSSQKADFYGIVDNATVSSIVSADISSSAGIMDTQLNTISTGGKVNTSALTGQIANANLAQLVNAALVSGAALTLLPNIPSGAGLVPVANIPIITTNYGSSASAGSTVTQTLRIVYGTQAGVSSGSPVTISNLPFTSTVSYVCITTNATGSGVQVSSSIISASSITLSANSATQTICWVCIGY
jgi:hypothetical protein